MRVDAVVIGAGPNGLVAANLLADRGWDVVVCEAQPEPGGAVRSDESLEDGFVTDRFSAFYPLGVVSPHLQALELEQWGLRWVRAPDVLAHPTPDGPAAVLAQTCEHTALSLDAFAPGDGDAWMGLQDEWDAIEEPLIAALMDPFPPVRSGARLLAGVGLGGARELLRRGLLPVRRMAEEHFDGAGGGLLLAGCALHADLTPDSAPGGFLGWLLAGVGQRHGWPVPEGGAGALTAAMVARLEAAGGRVLCNRRVACIGVRDGRAVAVTTSDGDRIEARRAVIADVVAPNLFGRLLDPSALPTALRSSMRRYQPGSATFKVNWTLDAPVPWDDPAVAGAGTVHLAASMDELTLSSAQLAMGLVPADPFVLVGQMSIADPTRSPPGTESLWAYTNVPQTVRGDAGGDLRDLNDPADAERFADRIEDRIVEFAPAFRSEIRRRSIQTPGGMEAEDANLIGGDQSLGTAQLHQQLVFRPVPGLGRAETPVDGLFLASASAHPGGGVHGACGANAARAAVAADRRRRLGGLLPMRRAPIPGLRRGSGMTDPVTGSGAEPLQG